MVEAITLVAFIIVMQFMPPPPLSPLAATIITTTAPDCQDMCMHAHTTAAKGTDNYTATAATLQSCMHGRSIVRTG